MPNIGATELLIILVIVVLLFGSKKLPDLAKSVSSSMRELRKGMNDEVTSEKSSDTAKKSA